MGCFFPKPISPSPPEIPPPLPPPPPELRVFEYEELRRATQQFEDSETLLGEGCLGKVYKGWLRDPLANEAFPVAVKKFNPYSLHGQSIWLANILVLGRLRHPNLVQMIGCCVDRGECLLVYEFLARGSVDDYLFRERNPEDPQPDFLPPLSWNTRLRIALGAAEGLAFLHENDVVHRNFGARNIFLDENYCAKLIDFGLLEAEIDITHYIIRIGRTSGYLDPKYIETGLWTKKCDVYAFGILLLELLTGCRISDQSNPDQQPLVIRVQPYLQQRKPIIKSLIDPDLKEQLVVSGAQRAACHVAICARNCIKYNQHFRPLMSDIVEALRPLVQPIGT